ncbi:MAG: hypothetical protein R3C44_07465 [Chloroflexota bacterium]
MKAQPEPTRPWTVSVVLGIVLALGIWNLGRALILWQQVGWLRELETEPDPVIRLSLALGWFLLFGVVAWAILRRSTWVLWAAPVLFVVYAVMELGLRLIYATPPAPVLLLLYAVSVIYVFFAFSRPSARRYFEHTQ